MPPCPPGYIDVMLSVVRPADRSCSRDCDPGGMNELIFKPDKWAVGSRIGPEGDFGLSPGTLLALK